MVEITGHGNSESMILYLQMDIEHQQRVIEVKRSVENIASQKSQKPQSLQCFATPIITKVEMLQIKKILYQYL